MKKTTYIKPGIKVMQMEEDTIMAASDAGDIAIDVDNSSDGYDGTFRAKPQFIFLDSDND